jgi:tetratricopeptide (TPR) repeat protein
MKSAKAPEQDHSSRVTGPGPHYTGPDDKRVVFGICVLLAVAVLLVFGQTLRYEFVNLDDNVYVYQNPVVMKGLTSWGIIQAFTHSVNSLYHPLTMLSLMLDGQVYGLNPGGYHLTNVLLQAATAILLFLVLRRMMMSLHRDKSAGDTASPTGALWPSAFVAAVFAIHPLRAESVAWVSERKDVLSGLFFMLTLLMYAWYVEQSKTQSPKARVSYGFMLLFYAWGLLSKPSLVTLPFVLLLLDYWPLERFMIHDLRFSIRRLLLEKIPLFALAAVFSLLTFITQKNAGALAVLERQPLTLRWENVLVSYATYILKTLWPENLAALYPYQAVVPAWEIIVAGGLLLSVTVLTVMFARRFPYLLVGWLWYLGMLVPMIGIVQIGFHSHADRYTYLPQIGLGLAVAFAARDSTVSWRHRRQALGAGAFGIIVVLMVCAWKQTSYWRDSESLWTHTLACTTDNAVAHINLSLDFAAKGRLDEAIEHCQKAIEISPNRPQVYNNLGTILLWKGRRDDAITNFARAIQVQPDDAEARLNWGVALASQGKMPEAIALFKRALELKPDYTYAHFNLGIALASQGLLSEAIEHYQKAIQLNPDYAEAHYQLGTAFGLCGRLGEAVEQFKITIELKPDDTDAHGNLAKLLATQGKLDEAIKEYQRTLALAPHSDQAHFRYGQALQAQHHFAAAKTEYQKALDLNPQNLPAYINLAWLLATCPDSSLRDGEKAVTLAQQAEQPGGIEMPQLLDTLAAADAEAGRFDQAVIIAKRALNLPATQNDKPLAEAIRGRLELYEAHVPYHEKP